MALYLICGHKTGQILKQATSHLPEPMLSWLILIWTPRGQIPVKFKTKYTSIFCLEFMNFNGICILYIHVLLLIIIQENYIWKFCLQNVSHFVPASMLVFVFHKDRFQLHVPFQCWEMIENRYWLHIFFYIPLNISSMTSVKPETYGKTWVHNHDNSLQNKCRTADIDWQNLGRSGKLSFFIIYKYI